ncbi:GerMN domain-containing protein [Paenibacillus rigui]|nr:GerMN domain-containing protein [Paenibacillus rigui]
MTLIALLSACGQAKTPDQTSHGQTAPKQEQTTGSQPASSSTSQPVNESKQMKIKAYFGDENGEKLVEKEVSIRYKQEDEKYSEALKALGTSPDPKQLALLQGFTVRSVVLKDKTLTVDVSMSPESRLGSGGEALLLEALKKTLFQFSEIDSFDVLLDGKAVESLMGHMDLPHPIQRNS